MRKRKAEASWRGPPFKMSVTLPAGAELPKRARPEDLRTTWEPASPSTKAATLFISRIFGDDRHGFSTLVRAWEAGEVLVGEITPAEVERLLPTWHDVCGALSAAAGAAGGPRFFVDAWPLVCSPEEPWLRVAWELPDGSGTLPREAPAASWPLSGGGGDDENSGFPRIPWEQPATLHLHTHRLLGHASTARLGQLMLLVDAAWRGEGAAHSTLVLGAAGAHGGVALPPHARNEDLLIFVCDGEVGRRPL